MSKSARIRQARRVPPPPTARGAAVRQRTVWLATGALAVIVGVVVVVLLATRSTPSTPAPAAASAADRSAPASLLAAANAVGFHPTTEPGVGQVESEPASAASPPANPNLLAVGTVAPGFTRETPQGVEVSLASLRGKAVLLEFFATWCPHCNAEAPHLRELAKSLAGKHVAFLSVNADGETGPSVYAFHRYYGLTFPALVDPGSPAGSFSHEGAAGAVSTRYRVQDFPTFYVIDPAGRIAWRGDGEQPDALLRSELLKASRA